MTDDDYKALKPDASKQDIVQALCEALSYYIDGASIDDPVNAKYWNADHTVYSAPWSPSMARVLVVRAGKENWSEVVHQDCCAMADGCLCEIT